MKYLIPRKRTYRTIERGDIVELPTIGKPILTVCTGFTIIGYRKCPRLAYLSIFNGQAAVMKTTITSTKGTIIKLKL